MNGADGTQATVLFNDFYNVGDGNFNIFSDTSISLNLDQAVITLNDRRIYTNQNYNLSLTIEPDNQRDIDFNSVGVIGNVNPVSCSSFTKPTGLTARRLIRSETFEDQNFIFNTGNLIDLEKFGSVVFHTLGGLPNSARLVYIGKSHEFDCLYPVNFPIPEDQPVKDEVKLSMNGYPSSRYTIPEPFKTVIPIKYRGDTKSLRPMIRKMKRFPFLFRWNETGVIMWCWAYDTGKWQVVAPGLHNRNIKVVGYMEYDT